MVKRGGNVPPALCLLYVVLLDQDPGLFWVDLCFWFTGLGIFDDWEFCTIDETRITGPILERARERRLGVTMTMIMILMWEAYVVRALRPRFLEQSCQGSI